MKTLKQLQYVAVAIVATVFFEGMLTLGAAFQFENYNWFAWFVQAVVFAFAVTTALRLVEEGN
jgi:hypothetical protein